MLESLPESSSLLMAGFAALAIMMACCLNLAVLETSGRGAAFKAGCGLFFWIVMTGGLGYLQWLDQWDPPRLPLLMVIVLAMLIWSGWAGFVGRLARLPIVLLVGYQSFRIPVELLIHRAVQEGIAPEVLTWTGNNLDILPALTALLLIPFVKRVSLTWLQIWNLASAAVLLFTVASALLATPSPLQQIFSEPVNVWIVAFPFIWLPTLLVPIALLGHIVLFRKLRSMSCHDRAVPA